MALPFRRRAHSAVSAGILILFVLCAGWSTGRFSRTRKPIKSLWACIGRRAAFLLTVAEARLVLLPTLGPISLEPGANGELWPVFGVIDLSALRVGVCST